MTGVSRSLFGLRLHHRMRVKTRASLQSGALFCARFFLPLGNNADFASACPCFWGLGAVRPQCAERGGPPTPLGLLKRTLLHSSGSEKCPARFYARSHVDLYLHRPQAWKGR